MLNNLRLSSLRAVFLVMFASAPAFAYDFSDADDLFAGRGEADTNITAAINAYTRSFSSQLTRAETIHAATQIARLHAYRGLLIPESRLGNRRPHFQRCMQAVERLDPSRIGSNPDFYFWKASCLALWAEANGVLSSLSHSKQLISLATKGRAIDASYEGGGFDRVLGVAYAKLPAINPFGPRGDLRKALTHFRNSVNSPAYSRGVSTRNASGEYFFETYFYYAEALVQANQRQTARNLVRDALERIESGDVPRHRLPETRVAERMLRQLSTRL